MTVQESNSPVLDSRWSGVRRILAVRPDAIGDVMMTSPALRALKESIPGATVTLLTSEAGAAVAPHLPEIDEVLVLPVPWVREFPSDRKPEDVLASIEDIRARAFDAFVFFGNYDQNPGPALMAGYLAGIPLRLAHSQTWLWHLLTDWVRDPEPRELIRHSVERELAVVAHIGCMTSDVRLSFGVRPEDIDGAREAQESHGVDPQRPWIVVHPGVSEEIRRYPDDGFVEVIRALERRTDHQIVLTGSATESELCTSVAKRTDRAVSLAGTVSIGAFGALLQGAALAIANNTATSHISAAVNTPVVVLYARTNPQHQPWKVPSHVLYFDYEPCEMCAHAYCLSKPTERRSVAPEVVVRAALDLLGTEPAHFTVDMPELNY